jgi:hypothetical protein
MCNPACEEERRIGYIARIPATDGEKIAGMVQSHKGHDQATKEINTVESWSSSRDRGTVSGQGAAPSCNRGIIRAKFWPSKHFSDSQAGDAKLPGLFVVARHSGVRSLLASDRARRTPSASKSFA